jgi:hypothetical protein
MQCRRAGTDGERIGGVDELREVLLKALYLRSRRNPVRTQGVDDFADFFLSDRWGREREQLIAFDGMTSSLNQEMWDET